MLRRAIFRQSSFVMRCITDAHSFTIRLSEHLSPSDCEDALGGFSPPALFVHSSNSSAREKMLAGINAIETLAKRQADQG